MPQRAFALVTAPLSLTLAFAILVAPLAEARPSKRYRELVRQMDGILQDNYPADGPGAAVLVVKNGRPLYRAARGMADLEQGIRLTPDMVFRLGSITKQFTAAAIMMLADEGKLRLDDPLTRFLPDYPMGEETITVEHLLTHTSGIKSYTEVPGWMSEKIIEDLTLDELIEGFQDLPKTFPPGDAWHYNNSGYVLLGAIIEKASGLGYAEFIDQRIFAPLKMTSSYYGDFRRIIPRRVSGYDGSRDDLVNARYMSMSQPHAAGSLLSTVDDLARWNDALFDGRVVSHESLKKMTTEHSLDDGKGAGYGYGLIPGELRGRPMISHGGGIFGFSTHGLYLPEEDVYVAVLTNYRPEPSPAMVAHQLAALAIGDPYPPRRPVRVSEEVLARYVGVYRIDETTTRTVTLEDGALHTQRTGGRRLRTVPTSESTFFYPGSLTHFEFAFDASGSVTGMNMYQNGAVEPSPATLTDEEAVTPSSVDVSADLLGRYVGDYELAPGFNISVTREGGRLFTQATGQERFAMVARSETVFAPTDFDAELTFVVGDDGSVSEAVLRQGGQDMRIRRVGMASESAAAAPTVSESVLRSYVGDYELGPGFVLAVTTEGGQLFIQATGQPRFGLHARSETEFGLDSLGLEIAFVRGAGGAVNELVLRQAGQELTGRRKG
ncbi:MAG: serine hydrolase [Acidobacteriota bacterium]